jgi:hypothetical protein
MYRFMNIRIGAISVLVVIILLCFLAASSFAVTIEPINGNKKIVEPEPTPYWEMAEPGPDPGLRSDVLYGSGNRIDCPISIKGNCTPKSKNDIELLKILKIILFRIEISIFNYRSHDNI